MTSWALALVALLLLAAPALGESPAEVRRALSASLETGLIEQWQDRYRQAMEREREAQLQFDAASASYSGVRHHRRLRGERKAAALEKRESARTELEEAQRELAEMPELARRAGLPAGWRRNLDE